MPDLTRKIGLGTVQFGTDYGISNSGGKVSLEQVSKIIDLFKNHGGRILDTASAYGTSEEVLGRFDLSGFDVVSKCMPPTEGESMQDLLNMSLSKLKIKKLYGYLAHRPQYLLENPDIWQQFLQMKREGRVDNIGVSLNKPEELEALADSGIVPDLIQVPYNYFDRRFEEVCRDFKQKGGEVHTRSAFLQGLFFMPSEQLSSHFNDVKPYISSIQKTYSNLAGELLGFALRNTWADFVIVGVENVQQLALNYKSQLTTEGLPSFDKTISESILNPSNWNL